jgi:hypothetical protein
MASGWTIACMPDVSSAHKSGLTTKLVGSLQDDLTKFSLSMT